MSFVSVFLSSDSSLTFVYETRPLFQCLCLQIAHWFLFITLVLCFSVYVFRQLTDFCLWYSSFVSVFMSSDSSLTFVYNTCPLFQCLCLQITHWLLFITLVLCFSVSVFRQLTDFCLWNSAFVSVFMSSDRSLISVYNTCPLFQCFCLQTAHWLLFMILVLCFSVYVFRQLTDFCL